MNAPTNVHIVNNAQGVPLAAVLPYDYYLSLIANAPVEKEPTVPHEIVGAVLVDGISPVRAWREYLRLTQEEMASRLGISQPAYAKYEKSNCLRKATIEKIARAFGITPIQLEF